MINIFQIIDQEKKWPIRSVQKKDLRKLEYGLMYRRYRKLMELSFLDHQYEKKVYLVALVKNKVAGQIIIDWRILKDETKSDGKIRAYLYSLRVYPPYRSKGLGTAMILFCENFLRERGFKIATIACEKKNPRALKLYEKVGYKIFKEEESAWEFYDHNSILRKMKEPEWILEKELTT
ncbi:GNAT family N-acetyltransferase [Candidatus Gottesmanbacteria bacterium]|nr:GNAT family N-acetyltransferase [Candidatus Gottesmanbacteria bacterium]